VPDLILRLLLVLAVVGAAAAVGWWWQRRDGRVRASAPGSHHGFDRDQLRAVGLDPAGTEAVALLLGSPTCAPCETVKRILAEVAEARPGFRWRYADAADHLDLAERHHVMRVPTLFLLEPDGRILARTSGVPAARDLLRVLDRDGGLGSAA
jgi:thiol-disulfide isomerase/thioredoxin